MAIYPPKGSQASRLQQVVFSRVPVLDKGALLQAGMVPVDQVELPYAERV